MSSNARRISGAAVQPFHWGTPLAAPAASSHVPEPAGPAAPDADAVRADHQAQLAALEREAFASGYAAGERAGLEAGNKRAEAMLRRLAQTIDEQRSLRGTLLRQTEGQMVQLALAIAKKVLRRETTFDQDLLVAMARVALDRVGDHGAATIRLNPEDYAHTVQRHGDHWAGSRVTVIADPGVSRGGCLVESEFGFVDASVDAQFEQVAQAMAGDEQTRAAA